MVCAALKAITLSRASEPQRLPFGAKLPRDFGGSPIEGWMIREIFVTLQ